MLDFYRLCKVLPFILLLFSQSSLSGMPTVGPAPVCESGTVVGAKSWDASMFGTSPTACLVGCAFKPFKTTCIANICSSEFKSSGETCYGDGLEFGGTFPDSGIDDGSGGDDGNEGESGNNDNISNQLDSILAAIEALNGGGDVTVDNSDVVQAVDEMGENITRGLDDVNEGISALTESVDGVSETLGSLAEGDFASGTDVRCVGDLYCESYWETSYPDGLTGVLQSFSDSVTTKGFTDVLTIDLGTGSFSPKWELCFNNIGNMSFGCFELSISDYIWGFIRAIMMFSTVLLCRALVFGG